MPRIVFIGAGSVIFTRKFLMDIFLERTLGQSNIVLMDIDDKRLGLVKTYADKLVETHGSSITIEATTDRQEALKGADYVIIAIRVGGLDAEKKDFHIPAKYGFKGIIADTAGPGGIFRSLRVLPPLVSIVNDIDKICPEAILINYVNSMSLVCTVLQKSSAVQSIGLCHGIRNKIIHACYILGYDYSVDPETGECMWTGKGVPPADEVEYEYAGINHLGWITKLKVKGEDVYQKLKEIRGKKDELPELRRKSIDIDSISFDMMDRFGLFNSVSSNHVIEYVPYYIKKDVEYVDPHYERLYPFFHLDKYIKLDSEYDAIVKKMIEEPGMPLTASTDEGVSVIKGNYTGETERVHGSVLNKGYLKNVIQDFSVEIPVEVDDKGLHPQKVDDLPPGPAAITNSLAMSLNLAAEGFLQKDPGLIRQALAVDPITASICTLDEIDSLFNEMWEANKEYLDGYFDS